MANRIQEIKELTYEIIGTCDLNCIHCSTMSTKKRTDKVELEEFKRNILLFVDFNVIRLSGGEPFHHPDIIKMVDFALEQRKRVEILSS